MMLSKLLVGRHYEGKLQFCIHTQVKRFLYLDLSPKLLLKVTDYQIGIWTRCIVPEAVTGSSTIASAL